MREATDTEMAIFFLKQFMSAEHLADVDWQALEQKFGAKVKCTNCGKEQLKRTVQDGDENRGTIPWLNFDEEWWCPSCRDGLFAVCDHCFLPFPNALLYELPDAITGEGVYCVNCKPIVENRPLQVGDWVHSLVPSESYGGQVIELSPVMVNIRWHKWQGESFTTWVLEEHVLRVLKDE